MTSKRGIRVFLFGALFFSNGQGNGPANRGNSASIR